MAIGTIVPCSNFGGEFVKSGVVMRTLPDLLVCILAALNSGDHEGKQRE